jgi:ribosomal protein S18 acetylase RimI-like enzyme
MSGMSLQVVRVRPSDWQRYRDIRLEALAASPDAYASSLEVERRHTAERWQQLIAGSDTFIAVEGGCVLGTATGWPRDPGVVHLVAMYVVPEARGRRIAHRLIDEVVAAARDTGAERVLLEVAERNTAAARSYLAYGFTPTGHRHPMDREPDIIEIEMELPLRQLRGADALEVVGGPADDDHR